ncbi:sensor histidine kinase [Desulfitobacterium sp. AusDCA]|uniref:sensor histidine kinase n=2 Tax=Desulfitobacterium sp. AusDCA TaxID=3240383 RepID=UPI003DA79D34
MFQEIRIRLAAINTLILFILLALLGSVLYTFTYHQLYRNIDQMLIGIANRTQTEHYIKLLTEKGAGRAVEHRVISLLWDKDGNLHAQIPQDAFSAADLVNFKTNPSNQQPYTLLIAGHNYRTLSRSIPLEEDLANLQPDLKNVQMIQYITNIDLEAKLVRDLMILLLVMGIAGGGISLLAGFFLANRALIPINVSWNKQQQFVADASHELRTPLAILQSQLELLLRHPEQTIEEESIRIHTVLTEIKRLGRLVADLLFFARSGSNQLELEQSRFSLYDLINTTTEQFRPLAEIKGVRLNVFCESDLTFYGDQERIHQLLLIILDNALKFTSENGLIELRCQKSKKAIRLELEDTGIGISEHDLSHIFDRFFRSDKARSRVQGGTGLGLAIAKQIVEAHHGQIWAESILNQGTTIHCVF